MGGYTHGKRSLALRSRAAQGIIALPEHWLWALSPLLLLVAFLGRVRPLPVPEHLREDLAVPEREVGE